MTHLESFRANTVDAKSAYVAINRARQHAAVYTDSKDKLAEDCDAVRRTADCYIAVVPIEFRRQRGAVTNFCTKYGMLVRG